MKFFRRHRHCSNTGRRRGNKRHLAGIGQQMPPRMGRRDPARLSSYLAIYHSGVRGCTFSSSHSTVSALPGRVAVRCHTYFSAPLCHLWSRCGAAAAATAGRRRGNKRHLAGIGQQMPPRMGRRDPARLSSYLAIYHSRVGAARSLLLTPRFQLCLVASLYGATLTSVRLCANFGVEVRRASSCNGSLCHQRRR